MPQRIPIREPKPPISTRAERVLIDEAFALGVPRDHGTSRQLRRVREARSLRLIGLDTQSRPQWMTPSAAHAWARMRDAAARDATTLHVVSAFRSVEYQLGIIRRKLERGLSMDEILRVSAAPGFSEHHSGRAFDLTTPGFVALEEEFEKSAAFAWLRANASTFGFRMSYPRGNPHGISYEPWHWCWHARG
ncbi:MAG TPA: M15 family metallopeptidase [Rudaea sp.]|jgi:D-alanyl-D-alanine carboxypeptidase|nr:M15 family metallopeptidase [Rudaea sp.]